MSIDADPDFLRIGGIAAGAGIASSIAGLVDTAVPSFVPIVGGIIGFAAMKFCGVLDKPESTLLDPAGSSGKDH